MFLLIIFLQVIQYFVTHRYNSEKASMLDASSAVAVVPFLKLHFLSHFLLNRDRIFESFYHYNHYLQYYKVCGSGK